MKARWNGTPQTICHEYPTCKHPGHWIWEKNEKYFQKDPFQEQKEKQGASNERGKT